MDRGRVGEDRGSKETDGCPLTPGQSMGKPDALSRQADHVSGQGDNDNLTLLAPELFRIHVLASVRLKGDERNIL
jgi:hypothetical protein